MNNAATNYQIIIDMSDETVAKLDSGGYFLYAFKAVAAGQEGGAPTVWFKTETYSLTTTVDWNKQYQAYTSQNEIVANGQIVASASYDIDLHQTLQVVTDRGTGQVVQGGQALAIAIDNQTSTEMTCGISELVGSKANPMCAFPLYGNQMDVIAPIEKVLLMFATDSVNTGTVIERALSVSLLVDLTADNQRSVEYDINQGWAWGGGAWATEYAPETALTPLLIETAADTRLVANEAFERRALIAA